MRDKSRTDVGTKALLIACGALMTFLAVAMLVSGSRALPSPVAAPLVVPIGAAALIEATSGERALAVEAVGTEARMINASMPVASGPIASAQPFALRDSLDHRRALLCLTQAVYYEAGFEPLAGRRAVAQVVLNRMRHPAFPKSVCGVVYQRNRTPVCQFSFVCDGALSRAPAAVAWQQARDIAAAALDGHVEAAVGSATHYHAEYVAPRWASMLHKIARLGAHIFYRWPGTWGTPAAFTGRYIGEPTDPAFMRPALRLASTMSGTEPGSEIVAAIPAAPPIARAENDVGGLLDTSKGWTLDIPLPSETGAASKAIAEQQSVPSPSAPLVASR